MFVTVITDTYCPFVCNSGFYDFSQVYNKYEVFFKLIKQKVFFPTLRQSSSFLRLYLSYQSSVGNISVQQFL